MELRMTERGITEQGRVKAGMTELGMTENHDANPLRIEDQLVFDILGLLNRVPLSQRESILATVGSFVVSEQDAQEEEMKRKVISKLTRMGCRVEERPGE